MRSGRVFLRLEHMPNTNRLAPLTAEFRCQVYGQLGWATQIDADTFEVQLDGEERRDWWTASQVEAA